MTLIKSISGIRGTIGGRTGEGLSPVDVVKFTAAYGEWLLIRNKRKPCRVITGRDARVSGEMVNKLVAATLNGMGINVCDLGMAATPTVELAVSEEKAEGGIILTASHNPSQWNALKLLNEKGEFLSARDGEELINIVDNEDYTFAEFDKLGEVIESHIYNQRHIDMILALEEVDTDAIRERRFKVAVDCVNSVGGIILPDLLRQLGVDSVIELYTEPNGIFPHNPEPLPENLKDLSLAVKQNDADVGFTVDPDVDRLAIVSEDGSFFNEEYTIVACADYVLSRKRGNTVTNMSSSRALRDLTIKYGGEWFSAAVGEVNVVKKMKEVNAVIGGEGNGGVIYPPLHYGRDALIGIALFLSLLAKSKLTCSALRKTYPEYVISKNRIELGKDTDPDIILDKVSEKLGDRVVSREDGILAEDNKGWVQVRKSNTEAILRIYSEGVDLETAENLAGEIIKIVKKLI